MALPKSNNRKLQLSLTDSAFPNNCNMFGPSLAGIVSIQAHLPEFVLQTDIANKETTGFFCQSTESFFTASDQLSRSKQSLQFFIRILVRVLTLLSNTIYQHIKQIFGSTFTGRPTLFTFSLLARWTKKYKSQSYPLTSQKPYSQPFNLHLDF